MSLLLRINAALGAVFLVAAALAGYVCWTMLEDNAQREVLAEAGLMMDSAAAVRSYTAKEILPLIAAGMKTDFPPQSVPSYAATQNFLHFHEHHPDYAYKEATLNPTNPRDRAAEWEGDIIQRFRNDAHTEQVVGVRDTPMGKSLYLARPIRAKPECLVCHSIPSAAPQSMIARYGSDNGFGWQPNEVVAAQVVSVPFESATANANKEFRAFMILLVGVFAAAFVVVNILLYRLVVRPVRRIAAVADQVSQGDMSAPEFPAGRRDGDRVGHPLVRAHAQEPGKSAAAPGDLKSVAREVFVSYSQPDYAAPWRWSLASRARHQLLDRAARYRAVGRLGGGNHRRHFQCARDDFGFLREQQRFTAGAPRSGAGGAQEREHPAVSHRKRGAFEESGIFLEFPALDGCLRAAAGGALRQTVRLLEGSIGQERTEPQRRPTLPAPSRRRFCIMHCRWTAPNSRASNGSWPDTSDRSPGTW